MTKAVRLPRQNDASNIGLAVGGVVLLGLGGLAFYASRRLSTSSAQLPSDSWQAAPTYSEADVEAAARMLASENPRGSSSLHVELIWSQIRSRKTGQSLFDRITAGSGWGAQGERAQGGGVRPVATGQAATPALRQLAREVLEGTRQSKLPGARKFFEPAQQDRAFAVAERARQKQRDGQPLTTQETRLLGYRRNADEIRKKWLSEGSKLVGDVDGVEFFT